MQQTVELTDEGHPRKPSYFSNLASSHLKRFERLRDLSDIQHAISNMGNAVDTTDDGNPEKRFFIMNLGATQLALFEQLGQLPDLDCALSNLRKAAKLTNDGDPKKPHFLSNLGNSQKSRFECLGTLYDIEDAISNLSQAVELTDDGSPTKAMFLVNLGVIHESRFRHLKERADLLACIDCFRAAAQAKAAYPTHALSAARKWAMKAHSHAGLALALDGYRTALEILPKVAWLGLSASSRHEWLLREQSEDLGCLAATCAIQLGHFEEAVELVDLGRSVFWKQASSLRSDLAVLKEEHPELAEKLEHVGHKLDAGNFSGSSLKIGGHEIGFNNVDADAKGRRHLVDMWEGLVGEVRKHSKFEYFLKPIPFLKLRHAVIEGQVIIINVSAYGVDALIFGTTGPIEHVPLPNMDLETLAELSGNVVRHPSISPSAAQRQAYTTRFLKLALRMVWHDILIHIFHKIHIPIANTKPALPQHRISWYPTGHLTFIPIHASGPRDGVINVSQLVISSYVTTLESLLQVWTRRGPVSKGPQKFLCISQPETPGHTCLPQTTEEVDQLDQLLCSSGWPKNDIICLHGSDATVYCVLDALDICSWVHLACHGYQHPIFGMESAFSLHDTSLKLSQIASHKLSIGQFAFLSACHSASGLSGLPGEAIHLAAGLQFAGFPSVIATMWGVCDVDAPQVAIHTYQYLFRNGLQGLDPSEAATALNHAVLQLQGDPDMTVDRWAPFIHYGI